MKYRCAGEVGALMGAIFYAAFGGENLHNRASPVGKPYNRPAGLGNAFPLWWLAAPPCPVGCMSLDSRVAGLPYEIQFLCHLRKRGHYKTPLYCELLMKGLLYGALFFPRLRGKSGAAG